MLPSVLGEDLLQRLSAEYGSLLDDVLSRALASGELGNPPDGDFLGGLRSVHGAGVDWLPASH